ncbi:small highly charged protein [Shewanella algicola]|nr:small highly charged protein [Shewanella algicola]
MLKMSHSFEFDEDDAPWGDNIKGKPKSKKVKQRRRDTKRRYFDDNAEVEFAPVKWK